MGTIDFTNLRIFIDDKKHDIYTDLTGRAAKMAEDKPFIKMPDLFITAACIGARDNLYLPIDGKKRDIFVADALDQNLHVPIIASLGYQYTGDTEILLDPRGLLDIVESYANGGIDIIYDIVQTGEGLRPLYRFMDFVLDEISP